jgi:hypothetical protein
LLVVVAGERCEGGQGRVDFSSGHFFSWMQLCELCLKTGPYPFSFGVLDFLIPGERHRRGK